MSLIVRNAARFALAMLVASSALANTAPQPLPATQDWTNIGLITANDDWSNVPGIEGFLGQDLTTATGTDPQTILTGASLVAADLSVLANQTVTTGTGGDVGEFHTTSQPGADGMNPVIALQGSGTADAPHIIFALNTTGQTDVTVAYSLRDIDCTADNAIQPVALQFRVGNSGNFTNLPAGFVLDASQGPSLCTLVTSAGAVLPAAANNQAVVQIRIITANAVGSDEWIGIDNISVTGTGGPGINLSTNDVAVAEGNAGTATASFTVSLSNPAGPGGVTFDIATADNTATVANNDYVARSLVGQTIPMGASTYTFDVTVNGDTALEPNETFFVNVTNVVGATATDAQGQGTITNDDFALTPINQIQGPGSSSPLVGTSVVTSGIVTGRKSNGFFIQEPDATVDANPLTSEGIFVFTSAAPPASATIGNLVQVAGMVLEFVPTQDPLQPPLTQISGSPTITQLSVGNPLPAPIPLTLAFPSAAGAFDQLERIEAMRASAASLTANSGTLGSVNEANATATSNGIFSAVVTGNPRSLREPGIQAPDTAPQGTIPPIPRWDSNPEVIQVDSDAQGNTQININAEAVVLNVVGPLDYGFRRYTILQDGPPTPAPTFSGGQVPTAVSVQAANELTVATYNLERFFDTVNDPAVSEVVLTPAAFEMRLNKASLGIRNFLRTPDILGVVEMENLSTLQTLATRISTDAVAALQPDPLYEAFLIEGNDIGGIDVGFLVKRQIVTGTTPRVTVNAVVQENDGELFVNPDASTETLNDRPTLRLDAVVNNAAGGTFPLTVMVNHLRSLNGSDDRGPGSNGWATAGERVRAKRQRQAESLANLVQARQIANPLERIVLVGDFNAFEFNDGLGDSIGVIDGTPSPDNETAVPGDGIDLVNPDLAVLLDAPLERYSFVFGGVAQTLDHVLVNQAMLAATTSERVEHARINADFGALERNSATTPSRLADHDPIVAFFGVTPASADLSVTKTDSPDPVLPGSNITYTITATNAGPDAANSATMTDVLPTGTTFVSLTSPAGWMCTTPAVGTAGTVNCANLSFAASNAVFTLVVQVGAGATGSISNTATVVSATTDPNAANNSATATTAVMGAAADLSITKTDSPDPVLPGGNITYTLTAANAGPSAATSAAVTDTLPTGTTFVSLTTPAGWTCTTPAVGASGMVSCTNPSFAAAGNAVFTLVVQVAAATPSGTVISNTAAIASTTTDPAMTNNTSTATTTVNSGVLITGTKTATGPFAAGSVFTYTIVLRNMSSGNQLDNPGNEFTDVLPATLELVSASSTTGTTVATVATRTVTFNGAIPAGGTVTITIMARIPASVPQGTQIANQGTFAFDADSNGTNESSGVTDNPATPAGGDATTIAVGGGVGSSVAVPALSPAMLAFLALMLAFVGMRATVRRA